MGWTGSIWLRIGTSGGLLWKRWWTFGFHKMLGSSWVAAQLAVSQDGLSSVNKQVYCPHFQGTLTPSDFTLNIETVCSSKTFVTIYQTIRHHIPENRSFNIQLLEDLLYAANSVSVLSALYFKKKHTLFPPRLLSSYKISCCNVLHPVPSNAIFHFMFFVAVRMKHRIKARTLSRPSLCLHSVQRLNNVLEFRAYLNSLFTCLLCGQGRCKRYPNYLSPHMTELWIYN
jgi:hypothetical protein